LYVSAKSPEWKTSQWLSSTRDCLCSSTVLCTSMQITGNINFSCIKPVQRDDDSVIGCKHEEKT